MRAPSAGIPRPSSPNHLWPPLLRQVGTKDGAKPKDSRIRDEVLRPAGRMDVNKMAARGDPARTKVEAQHPEKGSHAAETIQSLTKTGLIIWSAGAFEWNNWNLELPLSLAVSSHNFVF